MRVLKKSIWPYKVVLKVPSDDLIITDMESWLYEYFKTRQKKWYIVQGFSYTEFYFKTEKDANWFSLRWS